jgi:NTP pyrophosphatase (non-canonical NTP hydrolase)
VTFDEFQTWTRLHEKRTGWNRLTRIQLLAHLFEEAGELARSVNRTYEYRDKIQQEHIENIKIEIVDILWFVFKIADRFGVNVERELGLFAERADSWLPEKHGSKLRHALAALQEELES